MTKKPIEEQLREAGMTDKALNHPRDQRALVLLAAWTGVTVEQLPPAYHYAPNQGVIDAWARVDRAFDHLREENERLRGLLEIAARRGCDHCADDIRQVRAGLGG